MSAERAACVECGYDLAGVGAGRAEAQCPECGTWFHPERPWRIRPWPTWGRIARRMCRGTVWAGAGTWVLLLGIKAFPEPALALIVPLVPLAWLFARLWWPTTGARDLTDACMPKRGRERRRVLLTLCGIGLNALLALAWLVVTGVVAFWASE